MRKSVMILRLEEVMSLLDTVEDNIELIDPPQSKKFLDGFHSGLEIARKLIEMSAYEALEYDLQKDGAEAN